MSSFCSAKATHIFTAKNIRILYIESAKTVNEMTLNELVKLTSFEQLGPENWTVKLSNLTTVRNTGTNKLTMQRVRLYLFSCSNLKSVWFLFMFL